MLLELEPELLRELDAPCLPFDELPLDEPFFDELPFDELPFDPPSEELPLDEPFFDELSELLDSLLDSPLATVLPAPARLSVR